MEGKKGTIAANFLQKNFHIPEDERAWHPFFRKGEREEKGRPPVGTSHYFKIRATEGKQRNDAASHPRLSTKKKPRRK